MGRESLGRGAVHIQAGVQRLAPRGVTGLGPGPADALPSQLLGLPSALAGSAAPDFPVLRSKPCPGPWGSSRVGRVTFSLLTLVQVSCLHGHDRSLLPPPPVRGCKPCSCPGDVLVCLPPSVSRSGLLLLAFYSACFGLGAPPGARLDGCPNRPGHDTG